MAAARVNRGRLDNKGLTGLQTRDATNPVAAGIRPAYRPNGFRSAEIRPRDGPAPGVQAETPAPIGAGVFAPQTAWISLLAVLAAPGITGCGWRQVLPVGSLPA